MVEVKSILWASPGPKLQLKLKQSCLEPVARAFFYLWACITTTSSDNIPLQVSHIPQSAGPGIAAKNQHTAVSCYRFTIAKYKLIIFFFQTKNSFFFRNMFSTSTISICFIDFWDLPMAMGLYSWSQWVLQLKRK